MSIIQAMKEAATYASLAALNLSANYGTVYKGHSTKSGNSRKAIKARRKKNKNKKTHRK